MKRIFHFLKATILGGLFVLLPILLIYLMMAELLELAVALATPITDFLPGETLSRIASPPVVAVLLILIASFVFGLVMLAGPGRALVSLLERKVLLPLPGYGVVKSLTRSLGQTGAADTFKPALLRLEDGSRDIVYVIEDHGDGQATVMIPWSPTPMAGNVRIVATDRIDPLNTGLAEVTNVLTHWGVGTHDLLQSAKNQQPGGRS